MLSLCKTWAEVERSIIPVLLKHGPPIRLEIPAPSLPRNPLHQHNAALLSESSVYARLSTNCDATLNTLRYMFHHMRCGILVVVRGGQVVCFAPFANVDYVNTWSDSVTFAAGSMSAYLEVKAEQTRRPPETWLAMHRWWMNGGIACNVMPDEVWGSFHHAEIMEMLTACGVLPDCDFFINKRDYPHLRTDATEPYERFIGQHELLREHYSTYTPVVSFYGGSDFADLLMPTTEDWKLCSDACSKPMSLDEWHAGLPMAVWRGTATGNGITGSTNIRLRLVQWSAEHPDLCDAAITGLNIRDKFTCVDGKPVIDCLKQSAVARRSAFLPLTEQFKNYKYLVYAEGHCAANRYGALMHSGRVILKIETLRAKDGGMLWLFPFLVGAKVCDTTACIPEDADHFCILPDLNNLEATIKYLKLHDDVAMRVAGNAQAKAPTRELCLGAWKDTLELIHCSQAVMKVKGQAWFSPYDPRYAKLGRGSAGKGFECL